MGILDDAIREHFDLKRKHGARDTDLREIEDEAFGSTDRPDPFAANELFNEISSTGTAEAERPSDEASGLGDLEVPPGLSEPDTGGEDVGGEEATRLVEHGALRPSERPFENPPGEPISPPEGLGPIPGQV